MKLRTQPRPPHDRGMVVGSDGRGQGGITRTLQLTRPSVAALPRGLAAERQSLCAPQRSRIVALRQTVGRERGGVVVSSHRGLTRRVYGGPPPPCGPSPCPWGS